MNVVRLKKSKNQKIMMKDERIDHPNMNDV